MSGEGVIVERVRMDGWMDENTKADYTSIFMRTKSLMNKLRIDYQRILIEQKKMITRFDIS